MFRGGSARRLPPGFCVVRDTRIPSIRHDCSGVSHTTWTAISDRVERNTTVASRSHLPLPYGSYLVQCISLAKVFFTSRIALLLVLQLEMSPPEFFVFLGRRHIIGLTHPHCCPVLLGAGVFPLRTPCPSYSHSALLSVLADEGSRGRPLVMYVLGPP